MPNAMQILNLANSEKENEENEKFQFEETQVELCKKRRENRARKEEKKKFSLA